MEALTDRERLEQVAQQLLDEKEQFLAGRKSDSEKVAALEAQRLAESRTKTNALFAWCEQTFAGFKLPESGLEVFVDRAIQSKLYNPPPSQIPHVSLLIRYRDESMGNSQLKIPLALAYFSDRRYRIHFGGRVHGGVEREECWTLPEAQEHLLAHLASFDKARLDLLLLDVHRCASRTDAPRGSEARRSRAKVQRDVRNQ